VKSITERIVEGIIIALVFHSTIAHARDDNWRDRRGKDACGKGERVLQERRNTR
jgi:hypothetical protein